MFSLAEGCGCVSFRSGRRSRSQGDDSSSCRSSEIEQEIPKRMGRRVPNSECAIRALAPFLKFWRRDDVSMTKAERTMKAAILIQQWYRRYLARMEIRRRYTWTIFQNIEYAGEQDQVKLYNFFNALLSHMRDTSGRPSSERTSRTASVLEQVFSEESDEGGGVDETAPPKPSRGPDIEFPLQRKDIDLLIEAFRKKKHRLHPKHIAQILKEATQVLKRLPNINVATTSISSQITVCGDLHGKLDDLLVIFHKNGLPSPENPYIFNGDFVDRGKKGLEVFLLLLACMLAFPGGVYLNRGNHEDLIMNSRYGFIKEVHMKYRHNAERLLKLIECVYRWLPLGTIINNRVFVVHGGISDTTDLDMIRSLERDKYVSLLRPPVNESSAAGGEAIDKVEWKQVFDILWSDPQCVGGCVANALRGAGTYFGPDVTTTFLQRNKLSFLIRSHECKPGGYEIMHNGNVITIFSASNYYELGSNKGAYLKLCGNSLERQFVQYTAAVSRTRRLTFRQRVGLVESSAMRELHNQIILARRPLEATFRSMDLDQSGYISIGDWCQAMEETTHLGLPWRMLKDKLVRTDPETRKVRYMDTFELATNRITRKSDTTTVVETLYKNKRSLEAIFKILDKDNSGYITLEEFSEACQLIGRYMPNPMTQEQLVDICRLMDINKDGLVDLNEFLESFRLAEKSLHDEENEYDTHSSTPVVCLVIEGGTNTVRAVLEYVTDTPPVPVVVCDGSGRAADLIAFVHKYASETGEQTVLESMRDYLIGTIQKTFEVGLQQAECLYSELLQCTRKKNLITVFRIQERAEGGEIQELDQVILTALFRAQHLTPSEQLSLALTWNRVDIARSEVFVYGQEWPPGALDEAMMQALEHDRLDFVKLLLENGVSMRKFLTIPRLEELYNTKSGPSNTLRYILRDVRPHLPKGYIYTLHDIGLVINKLIGGAYRCYYTRRKFRPIYAKVMNKSVNVHRNSASFTRHNAGGLSLITGFMPVTSEMALFDYPFNELLMWAVLTKRHQMALLMWTHGEEALAKSLVACKLYKAMAHEAAEDDMETEVYEELRHYGKEFENKALELLDYCYRQDDDQAQQLLTCELQNWSGQTCLSLAVTANHRALLAHPCSQIILADLWMGGLRTRKNTNLKVILSLLCPLYIVRLEFKSKEELQLMPQTEEEHLENESIEDDRSTRDPTDAEVGVVKRRTLSIKKIIPPGQQNKHKALIGSGAECETRVDQNGKVGKVGWEPSYRELPEHHATDMKRMRPLRLRKKIYEFFTAPITKFWADSIAYILFLLMFTYTVLVKMNPTPSLPEIYSICYILTFLCEKIREIITSEPVAIRHKFSVWAWNMWNTYDAGFIIFFLVGLTLRLRVGSMDVGRVIYCVDIIYWYLRILNILGVNKYLGPLVTMMGKMVKNMIYFVVLLLVVLMSFGVARQAILYPDKEASWYLIREVFFQPYFMLYGEVFAEQMAPPCGLPGLEECRVGHWVPPLVMSVYLLIANILLVNLLIAVFNNIFIEVNGVSHQIFYQPYFMLYGEVFASDIDPECGKGLNDRKCVTGRWITPIAMTAYLLIANILLINLLIAVFNNIFNEVNEVSHQVWMFQRFTVVMEYEQKPVLPPPLIIFCHMYAVGKWVTRNVSHKRFQYDNGLKLFLEKEDMERLYDFEEECVEGYFREQEIKLSNSIEERVRNTTDRVEHITTKMEDLNQKANCQIQSMQGVEFRLRKLEDIAEQTMNHLAVIHRFMATHPSLVNRGSTDTLGPPPPSFQTGAARLRTASDRSEVLSDSDTGAAARFAVRPVQEEDEHTSQPSDDEHPQSGPEVGVEKVRADDSASTSSAGSAAGPDVTVIKAQPPIITPARQRSSDSNRTEPTDEKVPSTTDDAFLPEVREMPADLNSLRPRTTSAGTRRTANTRRRSEGGNDCGMGPHSSQHLAPRRQHSQTHSEPDNSAVDAGSVHNSITGGATGIASGRSRVGGAPRSLLLAMHEYTSITDELETVYGLFSPPHTPRTPITSRLLSPARAASPSVRRRHASEMSNPEFALYMEKEHLRGAEEDDYIIMENLIQRRYEEEEGGEVDGDRGEVSGISISVCVNTSSADQHSDLPQTTTLLTVSDRRLPHQRHSLRRSSAIDSRELPSPLQPLLGDEDCGEVSLPVPRQPSGDTNASSELSLSHMVSENLPPRPSIVLDSSQLPRQMSAEQQPTQPQPPAPARPETMC